VPCPPGVRRSWSRLLRRGWSYRSCASAPAQGRHHAPFTTANERDQVRSAQEKPRLKVAVEEYSIRLREKGAEKHQIGIRLHLHLHRVGTTRLPQIRTR
jgi:hypothetical protein